MIITYTLSSVFLRHLSFVVIFSIDSYENKITLYEIPSRCYGSKNKYSEWLYQRMKWPNTIWLLFPPKICCPLVWIFFRSKIYESIQIFSQNLQYLGKLFGQERFKYKFYFGRFDSKISDLKKFRTTAHYKLCMRMMSGAGIMFFYYITKNKFLVYYITIYKKNTKKNMFSLQLKHHHFKTIDTVLRSSKNSSLYITFCVMQCHHHLFLSDVFEE